MRRTSYPTSGYSLGTRGRRPARSRRLQLPARRRNPWIRALILVAALVLGSRVYAVLQSHHEMRSLAATAGSVTPKPAATKRAVATSRPAPTPTPTPSRPAIATQLPDVKLPVLSSSWLRTHPIAEIPAIKGRAAIVVDLTAGQILYQQDATSRYPDASLTKMMTAMVAADLAPMDTVITVPDGATQVEPNHMGVSAGEQLTLRELIEGMILDSGNDAAEAIAMGLVDRAQFIDFMNQKAARLHLRQTHFTNPSGLDDTDHASSAYDLAVISATLLQDYPDLRTIVGTKQFSIYATPLHKAFNPTNIDRLLWTYPGAIGIKPGYTGAAGYCLAAAATRNGRTIVVVVLGSTQHFTDATTLLDFGFRHPVTR
ncbi:MAG TPA: D-alanyl-D-alanine carboxypeptidase family protein [Candidatus Angelobacter sp.]|nr:D-alanyl-D-alanine carboxypeptidase family protein [Candidatus Angelobacter sp.]